jgi:hypothetical protein
MDVVPLAARLVVVTAFAPEEPDPIAEMGAEHMESENNLRLFATSERLTVKVGV